MYEYYFTFNALTAAQTAVQGLDRAGIPNTLARSPKLLQARGCGYSVQVRSGYFGPAKDQLQRSGVDYQRIYCRLPNGSFEEVEE